MSRLAPKARSGLYACRQCLALSTAVSYYARRSFHAGRGPALQAQKSVLSLLEERGYVNQLAGDRDTLDSLLRSKRVGFYAGVDPTAPSLHLGHLLPFMVLFWVYHHGHHAIALLGEGTARVGDPSGRLISRAETAETTQNSNAQAMNSQLEQLWGNVTKYGQRHGHDEGSLGKQELLNNATWLDKLNILDFLKYMGNGMRMGTMLGRDTVKNKMEKGDGMSFAEFTYPLLQGWDWWHMYRNSNIQVQVGGGDQFGNIVAGLDAVKYIAQRAANDQERSQWLDKEGRIKDTMSPMGLTVPLLTTSSGEKFGKSAGNAIWLNPEMTSAFDLYGFLLRSSDEDVERYLKLFTFVPMAEIKTIMTEHASDPGKRKAQHLLASEVLELVHGPEEAAKTRSEHQTLRSPSLASLANSSAGENAAQAAQRTLLPMSLVSDTPFSRILYHSGIAQTKSEGSRMIAKGGVYIALKGRDSGDGELKFAQIKDQKLKAEEYLIDGLLVFRIGKWKVRMVEVVDDAYFDAQSLDSAGWQEWKASRS